MKVVLAVSGWAQAGKDTFANEVETLAQGVGRTVVRFKFAEPLREAVQHAFSYLGVDTSPWTELKHEKDKLRPLLVALGEYARGHNEDVFASIVAREIENALDDADVAIVTDMRYANEDAILRRLCADKGWAYHHIHIYRVGNKPANATEEHSIRTLLESGTPNAYYTAEEGDITRIVMCASDYIRTYILPITTSRSR